MIFISGITLSFFLSLLLATKHTRQYADYLLAAWFLFSGFHQMLFYFDRIGFVMEHPFLAGVILPFPLLHGPFLFLYVSARVEALSAKKKLMNLLHFLPFLLCYVYLFPFFILPDSERLYIMSHRGIGYETFIQIKSWAIIASGLLYVGLSLRLLYRYQRNIVQCFSNLSKVDLHWLMYLTYSIGLIWLAVIFLPEIYTFLASVVFVALAGYFGLKHAGLLATHQQNAAENRPFNNGAVTDEAISIESESKKTARYEKSGLNPDKKKKLRTDLTHLMHEQKPFLNPDLTLDLLASMLSTNQHQLSQLINEEMKVTFYDYVNMLRVREFERLASLPDSRKFTLLALAYHSGFNSKSTFNRYFKKITGKSPSEYLRKINESGSSDLK